MRKYMLMLAMLLSAMLLSAVLFNQNRIYSQDTDESTQDPPAVESQDGDKKDEKADDKKAKDDEKTDKAKTDEEKAAEKKAKAEKAKKERAEKLSKSFTDFLVNGEVQTFKVDFFTYAVGYNVVTMDKKAYRLFSYVVYPNKSGIVGQAYMGQQTGWVGTNNGWAVFGAQSGSGLALKKATTVIFVPQSEDGSFGTPELVAPQDEVNGFFPYLVSGDGTGQYWVKTK